MVVKFQKNDKANPPGKLADAEIHFTDEACTASGPFAGLKLIGFAVWERRTGSGRNATHVSGHHISRRILPAFQ